VAILTDAFQAQMERVMSYYQADRPLPVVVVPHPMQNVGPDELEDRALRIADQAEQLLPPA
jgi:hypothetical protein